MLGAGQPQVTSKAGREATATLTPLRPDFKAPPPPKGNGKPPAAPDAPSLASGMDLQPIQFQFNPESLKLTYAAELAQRKDVSTTAQWVKGATAKLALVALFDTSGVGEDSDAGDVTTTTMRLRKLISPAILKAPKATTPTTTKAKADAEPQPNHVIPRVQFQWGTFTFTGYVESLEETLDFFSPEGRPLRATVSLTLVQSEFKPDELRGGKAAAVAGVGEIPALPVPPRTPFQKLLDSATGGQGWQDQARELGLENPRILSPGHYLSSRRLGGGGR